MSPVYYAHGVIPGAKGLLFQHRNLLDRDRFLDFLRSRNEQFIPLAEATEGAGDALTLDDATRAAFDAALLAREHGHEVTLFVNPYHVENQLPYWFHVLNVVLDTLRVRDTAYLGEEWLLRAYRDRNPFRRRVMAHLGRLPSDQACLDEVLLLGCLLGVPDPQVPPHLRTLSREDLQRLIDAGVALHNHGWTHPDLDEQPPAVVEQEVRRGRQWLADKCGVAAAAFAVPFGRVLPPGPLPPALCDCWYLADWGRAPGWVGEGVYNRKELLLGSQAGKP